ncbi:hypothetical protein GCM10027341_23620 [Spirosoma knui]
MEAKRVLGMALVGLFAFVGTIFLVVAYYTWQSTQQIMKAGVKTQGVVVDTRYNKSSSGRTTSTQAPVVQFTTAAGKPVTYYSQTYTSPPSFEIGETVTLWYLPNDPQTVTLEGLDGLIFPLVFGFLGGIFSLIGYPLLIGSVVKGFKR